MGFQEDAVQQAQDALERSGTTNVWSDGMHQLHVPLTSGHRIVFETPQESDHPWRVSLRRGGVQKAAGNGDYLGDVMKNTMRIGYSGHPRIKDDAHYGVISHFHAAPHELPDMLHEMTRHPGVIKAISDDQLAARVGSAGRDDQAKDYRKRATGWRQAAGVGKTQKLMAKIKGWDEPPRPWKEYPPEHFGPRS